MKLHWREGNRVGIGAGQDDLLRLTEVPGARRVRQATGLYHFALLYPNRRELAHALARLFKLGYPNHPTDHVISETVYLDDPEGQNVELYIRTMHRGVIEVINGSMSIRRFDGKPASGRDPLDVDDLFQELSPDDQYVGSLPSGTTMGHVHLYAANIADTMYFYHDILGFAPGIFSTNFQLGDVDLTHDQPHVVAFNAWKGENASPPPPNSLGMRYFSIQLPNQTELGRVLERVQKMELHQRKSKKVSWFVILPK